MSDDEGDLFADSDDTAELVAASKPEPKKATKKKLGGAAKRKRNEGGKGGKKIPDADDDDDDDDKGGLFDSDDEDAKPAAKKSKPLSKKEKMEALRKKRAASSNPEEKAVSAVPKEKKPKAKEGGDGYDSEDSYDSAKFELNEDDRNFIDTEGDDEDAVRELYAEQRFDDTRGEAEEDMEDRPRKKGKGGGSRKSSSRSEKLDPDADPDNPIMAAVGRMKKKKREQKTLTEKEDEAKSFLEAMERAAEEDEVAIKERRPATKKLAMLQTVVDMFTRKDMTRVLLDLDVLSIARRWIQPLPNGTLGNVTIRQRMLDSISSMSGDGGITPNDLKRSEFGKVVMSLYMHKSETPALKRKLKDMIEHWSRPIFQKSGNMRDLERVQAQRGEGGLAGISRMHMQNERRMEAAAKPAPAQGRTKDDLGKIIKQGKGKVSGNQANRVRIPYSKGFQFTVRPTGRTTEKSPDKGGARGQEARDNLAKRMTEKSRAVSKNQRSANISIEGRATKG